MTQELSVSRRPSMLWAVCLPLLVGAGIAGIVTGMLVASMSVPLPMLSSEVLPSVFDQGDAEVVFTVNAEETEQ